MADKPKKELGGPRKMSTGMKVAIGVFAVIMSLSMMLPSLSSIFAHDEAVEQEEEQAQDQNDTNQTDDAQNATEGADQNATEEGSDEQADDQAEVPDNETLKSLATQNQKKVDTYKARLKEDPKNLAALLNLGNTYMSWGYSAVYSGTTDEEKDYAKGLLDKAVEYYEQYLELRDSIAVKVDKALCSSYAGDTEKATKELEELSQSNADSPLVWANLGVLYEQQGDTEKANDAYKKAIETDPKNEYGAKSYANQRLISLNSTVSSPGDAGDASIDKISTAPESGLTSTLSDKSGVGF